jgi:hypothetical protein
MKDFEKPSLYDTLESGQQTGQASTAAPCSAFVRGLATSAGVRTSPVMVSMIKDFNSVSFQFVETPNTKPRGDHER